LDRTLGIKSREEIVRGSKVCDGNPIIEVLNQPRVSRDIPLGNLIATQSSAGIVTRAENFVPHFEVRTRTGFNPLPQD